jgi:ribosome biogenesis GTPase A
MTIIQWYPGHIAKLERQLKAVLQPVDMVLEVVDARAPLATRYPLLTERFLGSSKHHGLLLHKTDVADPNQTREWLHYARHHWHVDAYAFSTLNGNAKQVVDFVLKVGEPIRLKNQSKGLKLNKPIKLAILGMPNVGKSSLINKLVGKSKAATGHKAGVTREAKWVTIHPEILLLDTPGLIPSKLRDDTQGLLLACIHGVGDDAFDNEPVAQFLLDQLNTLYPGVLANHYQTPVTTVDDFAMAKRLFIKSELPDTNRAALRLLTDFRHGRLGSFTLETPTTD